MKKGTAEKFFGLIIAGLFLLAAAPVRGDATVYWDFDNGFSPATVVIGRSETVTWWNVDSYGFDVHVTFNNGSTFHLLDYQGQGVTFPSQPGVYGYSSEWGNSGAVIVNVPPTVGITAPANNAALPAPASFTVQAAASDTADDSVADVEFFLGTSDSTGITNLDAGIYTLLAVARDSRGWTATNAITITVGGTTPIILSSPRISTGKWLFDVTGLTAGKTNIVQVSTNLASWVTVKTNVAVGATMTVTNPATLARQFCRILQLP